MQDSKLTSRNLFYLNIKSPDSAAYTLKNCLSSELDKRLVQYVDDDIGKMWKCLDERYGDPSKLVDVVLNDIRKINEL